LLADPPSNETIDVFYIKIFWEEGWPVMTRASIRRKKNIGSIPNKGKRFFLHLE